MAELACHAGRTAHDPSRLDHPPAETGADDDRHRRPAVGVSAEIDVMGVQRRRVAVVAVDDRQLEPRFERTADVEPAPGRHREVGRALRGDDAVGARRARRVQPDPPHGGDRNPGEREDAVERLCERLDRHGRSLEHQTRQLHKLVDQKMARRVENGRLVGVAPVVEPDDHVHGLRIAPFGKPLSGAARRAGQIAVGVTPPEPAREGAPRPRRPFQRRSAAGHAEASAPTGCTATTGRPPTRTSDRTP